MTIDVATGIARILKSEGVSWVSTFPVSKVNNSFGREGLKLLMTRDDRYAVAIADAYSRVNNGDKIGVCTLPARSRRTTSVPSMSGRRKSRIIMSKS